MSPIPWPKKSLAERRAESAAALVRQREREAEEYERQRQLPTLEDKVQAVGEALIALLATLRQSLRTNQAIDPAKIADIAEELLRVLHKETRND
jgi:hypothetical protein